MSAIEARWQNGVPFCTEEKCGQYDGKRCRLFGFRPCEICEPAVRNLSIDHAEARTEIAGWKERAKAAEAEVAGLNILAEERLARAHQLQEELDAEMVGRLQIRRIFGARENEGMLEFIERVERETHSPVPVEVQERGWQWRPADTDTAFAPPFGTIRVCVDCGCLVAGGPNRCKRCAE